jgi:hypothetical protein
METEIVKRIHRMDLSGMTLCSDRFFIVAPFSNTPKIQGEIKRLFKKRGMICEVMNIHKASLLKVK